MRHAPHRYQHFKLFIAITIVKIFEKLVLEFEFNDNKHFKYPIHSQVEEIMVNVIVNGALGKMGQESVNAILGQPDLNLVASIDRDDDLQKTIEKTQASVVIDFTHPSCVKSNAIRTINAGCHAIIGTTGLSELDLHELDNLARQAAVGIMVIPNFAVGAVLLMKFAAEAAKHMPKVEIIEFHHDKKADAPSGTAIKTAEFIANTNSQVNCVALDETELITGCRGGRKHNIPIHSIRLPGYVASQEVIMGGIGQTLTIRHDTISRESFMPGVILCVRKINQITGLVYGLENVLEL